MIHLARAILRTGSALAVLAHPPEEPRTCLARGPYAGDVEYPEFCFDRRAEFDNRRDDSPISAMQQLDSWR
jgi:hypothetical protein